jgi:REP element-mobilizing transposase RayT
MGHLKKLDRVWVDPAVFFITTCTRNRHAVLADEGIAEILVDEWMSARIRHQWDVGRYVVMPDHVHFFCSPRVDAKPLSDFVGSWKQWTSKRIGAEIHQSGPLWQKEFFDHLIRSNKCYHQKWEYVKENPVRAELVKESGEWPWQGEVSDLSPVLWQ